MTPCRSGTVSLESLQALLSPEAIRYVVWITDWGGPLGWLIGLQAMFYLVGVRQAVFVGIVAMLALLTNGWLKWALVAPRPYFLDAAVLMHSPTEGFGMPSGHAQGAAALWVAMVTVLRQPRRWLLVAALLWVVAVGASRVILGVHSVAQVLVGWLLGLLIVYLGLRCAPRIAAWFAAQRSRVVLAWASVGGVLAFGISMLVLHLQAEFAVPDLWAANFAQHAQPGAALTAAALLDPRPLAAIILALLGMVLVALMQRRWPVLLATWSHRGLCVIVGLLVSGAFWWLAANTGIVETRAALLLPLLYPAICGYLPVWLVCKGRSQH